MEVTYPRSFPDENSIKMKLETKFLFLTNETIQKVSKAFAGQVFEDSMSFDARLTLSTPQMRKTSLDVLENALLKLSNSLN